MMDGGIWKPNVETSPTCPRCGSTNTKFCYYNNYSLTQPRYFCKSCRRYWTKGGSLRNVPVGGGCRKSSRSSRSGKPNDNIRASSSMHHHDGVNISRDYFSSSGRTGIITYCSTGSLSPPVAVAGAGDDGRPNINLALVYANFLNPMLKPSSEQTEPRLEIIPELPNVVGPPVPPPLQFSGTPDQTTMNTSTAGVFLECRSFSDRSSSENEHVTDGNPFYYGGGMNSFEKQQTTTTVDHHRQMNNTNDYLLLPPYLPGEETMSEEMVWPSSDLICSVDPVINADYESTKGNLPQVQDSNQVDEEDGSLFHIPNYGIFSGLDHK